LAYLANKLKEVCTMPQRHVKTGTVEGTGAAINVPIGFIPKKVTIVNVDSPNPVNPVLAWLSGMSAGEALKKAGNVCLAAAGLAIGTVSAAEVKIANTVTYLNKGVFKSKTTAEVAFTATTHDITAVAGSVQEAVYLISLQADGTPIITKGATATGAGNAVIPSTPAGETAIGYLRLAVAAGSTDFDATSDDLSAAHLTDTYVDFSSLGGEELITANGISQYAGAAGSLSAGFTIGADTDINVSGETILWEAYR
jgi:hypothetical protein